MKRRINSFRFAIHGLYAALKKEPNLRIHTIAAISVISVAFVFEVELIEWAILVIAIGLVIAAELLNSSLEKLCDLVTEDKRPEIKYIKDVAASAVLVLAVSALIVGLCVFYPYIYSFISN